MIFVPLGTQAMGFDRCLKMLDDMIDYHHITDKVIVQLGGSSYKSKNFDVLSFVPEDVFKRYMEEADVIISHAGSGALFGAISKGKKLIAVARLKEYHEMVDDHQTELTKKLSEGGYIIDGTKSLVEAWKQVDTFMPRKNDFQCNIVPELKKIIDKWLSE